MLQSSRTGSEALSLRTNNIDMAALLQTYNYEKKIKDEIWLIHIE